MCCWYNNLEMKRNAWLMLTFLLVAIISVSLGIIGWRNYQNAEVVIEWSSASELNVVGYHLYRSLDPKNNGQRITQNMIPVGDDLLSGNIYAYSDADLSPGTIYYYWLEEIDRQGLATRSGPIEIQAERDIGGIWLLVLGAGLFIGSVLFALRQYRTTRHLMGEKPIVRSTS